MRIAIVGAGGQVGAEVVLMLANAGGLELRPIVRTRAGSAFLRYRGVPVLHAGITDKASAQRCLAGCTLVVNFALAGGTPSESRRVNEAIIRATFEYSDPSATVLFLSTLAVHGTFDGRGRAHRTAYGDLKLNNERLVQSLAQRRQQAAYILRLGHVAGVYQGLTQLCRTEIMSPPIVMPDADRASNVVHTATIADAILAISNAKSGPPGLYDLVNVPQWTWREVYEREASELGAKLPLDIHRSVRNPAGTRWRRLVRGIVGRGKGKNARDALSRMMHLLPTSLEKRVRAEYYVDRARSEIAALTRPSEPRNSATLWPELNVQTLPGLRLTKEILDTDTFSTVDHGRIRWPADLEPGLS
jgi:nucleoside-diphosphate-sugar epimerase